MAGVPFWADGSLDAQAWNFCWLGEDFLPGLVEVEVDKGRAVDKQKSKGSDGPTLKDEGYEGAVVTITLTIWTAEQWDAWQSVRPKIDPQRAGGLRTPLAIDHPETQDAGVATVYVRRIRSGAPRGSKKTYTLDCLEWFAAPKETKTEKKPKTKDAGATNNTVEIPEVTVFG